MSNFTCSCIDIPSTVYPQIIVFTYTVTMLSLFSKCTLYIFKFEMSRHLFPLCILKMCTYAAQKGNILIQGSLWQYVKFIPDMHVHLWCAVKAKYISISLDDKTSTVYSQDTFSVTMLSMYVS